MTDVFATAASLPWIPTEPGVRRQILVHDAAMMMVRVMFEPGAVGSMHQHPHIQSSYVEAGVFDVTIDGITRRLSAGDAFMAPSNVPHGVVALEAGSLIDVFNPRREEFLGG